MTWGEWIIEISGLDGSRWSSGGGTGAGIDANVSAVGATEPDNTVQPIGNVKDATAGGSTKKGGCGGVLGIATAGGYMVFAPNNIGGQNQGDFCYLFKESYKSSGGNGNRIVPLWLLAQLYIVTLITTILALILNEMNGFINTSQKPPTSLSNK